MLFKFDALDPGSQPSALIFEDINAQTINWYKERQDGYAQVIPDINTCTHLCRLLY